MSACLLLLLALAAPNALPDGAGVAHGYELLRQGETSAAAAHFLGLVEADPTDLAAREGLTWALLADGRAAAAAREADRRLDLAPDDADWARERLHVMAHDMDRLAEARAGLAALRADRPADADLAVRAARLEARHGRRRAARSILLESLAAGGDPAALEAELAALEQPSERPAPFVRVASQWSEESTSFRRRLSQATVESWPHHRLRLRITPAITTLADDAGTLRRRSLGVEARGEIGPDWRVDARWRRHLLSGVGRTHEAAILVEARPRQGPLLARAGLRHRALGDVPVGYEELAFIESAGSGGASLVAYEERLQVREGWAGLVLLPREGAFAYLEVARGRQTDGNRRRVVAVGGGVTLAPPRGRLAARRFLLRLDAFRLEVDAESDLYWSPARFQVQSPGLQWHVEPRPGLVVGAEVAAALRRTAPTGWTLGVFAQIPLGGHGLTLEFRARHHDDTRFRQVAGTIGLVARL